MYRYVADFFLHQSVFDLLHLLPYSEESLSFKKSDFWLGQGTYELLLCLKEEELEANLRQTNLLH